MSSAASTKKMDYNSFALGTANLFDFRKSSVGAPKTRHFGESMMMFPNLEMKAEANLPKLRTIKKRKKSRKPVLSEQNRSPSPPRVTREITVK